MSDNKNIDLIKVAIKEKRRMEGDYKDQNGMITHKKIEPFAIGTNAKNSKVYTCFYQDDGESTSNTYTYKTLILDKFLSLELTDQSFDPAAREGFNPYNPIKNVELLHDEVFTVVDY